MVRIGLNSFCAKCIPHDIEMGIINRIVFVRAGGNDPERSGIKQFSSTECGPEKVAVALAAVYTPTANPGRRGNVTGSIGGL
jgi:hypothetical protein